MLAFSSFPLGFQFPYAFHRDVASDCHSYFGGCLVQPFPFRVLWPLLTPRSFPPPRPHRVSHVPFPKCLPALLRAVFPMGCGAFCHLSHPRSLITGFYSYGLGFTSSFFPRLGRPSKVGFGCICWVFNWVHPATYFHRRHVTCLSHKNT